MLVNRLYFQGKERKRQKGSAIFFLFFSFHFDVLLPLDDKIKVEIDKKTRRGGKRERRKEKTCLLVLLMLWPCFLARRRSMRTFFYFFFISLFSLYNDDVLFCETVLEKRSWGFSQV